MNIFNLINDNFGLISFAHDDNDENFDYVPVLYENKLQEESGITHISTENLEIVVRELGCPVSAEVVSTGNVLFYFDEVFSHNNPTGEPFVIPPVYLATGFTIGYRGEGPAGLATFLANKWSLDFEKTYNFVSSLPMEYRGIIMDQCPICG